MKKNNFIVMFEFEHEDIEEPVFVKDMPFIPSKGHVIDLETFPEINTMIKEERDIVIKYKWDILRIEWEKDSDGDYIIALICKPVRR